MSLRDWFRQYTQMPEREALVTEESNIMAGPFTGTDGAGNPVVEFTPSVVELIRIGANSASLGELYRTQWAVRTCVDFLALNQAHLNLKTYTRNEDGTAEQVREHPLNALIQRPNPYTTRFDLFRATVSDLAIYSNAYWLKAFKGNSREMYLLPPAYVQPKGGDLLNGIKVYEFQNGSNAPVLFPADNVVHFRSFDPHDPRIGSSILEALKAVLNEEIEASRQRAKFWKRGARIGGVVERPPDAKWSDDAFKRFREGWRKFIRGGALEEETAILEDGMKYNPISFSPKDAEFMAGREWALDTVATAYQIPLALLSRKNTNTFASMKEFHKVLYVDVLGSWNAALEGAINLQLVPDFNEPDLFVEFNIEEKLQGDFEQQADAARQSVQVPWMSVDDMRAIRGLPPLGGEYAVPARPANYLYGDQEPSVQEDVTAVGLATVATNGHERDAAVLMEER